MIEPGMMNIYWTKITLRAAANQAIYLAIFHWVVGTLYLSLLILLLDLCMGAFKRRNDLSLYTRNVFFSELKMWGGDISFAVPIRLKSGGCVPLVPHRSTPML